MSKFIITVAVTHEGFQSMFGDRAESMVGVSSMVLSMRENLDFLEGETQEKMVETLALLNKEYPETTWVTRIGVEYTLYVFEAPMRVSDLEELRAFYKEAKGELKALVAKLGKEVSEGRAFVSRWQDTTPF